MKFILIFGPPAVGKMTVGQELEKITGFRLFHNHMTIELVSQFFDFGTSAFSRLNDLFRLEIFKEAAKSNLKGLIFTYVWAIRDISDEGFIDTAVKIFEKEGAEVFFVELEAEIEERLKRNKTAHRLEHKPSKRDVDASEALMLKHIKKYRFNTEENEFNRKNYLKIDNTNLSAEETAGLIRKHFKL